MSTTSVITDNLLLLSIDNLPQPEAQVVQASLYTTLGVDGLPKPALPAPLIPATPIYPGIPLCSSGPAPSAPVINLLGSIGFNMLPAPIVPVDPAAQQRAQLKAQLTPAEIRAVFASLFPPVDDYRLIPEDELTQEQIDEAQRERDVETRRIRAMIAERRRTEQQAKVSRVMSQSRDLITAFKTRFEELHQELTDACVEFGVILPLGGTSVECILIRALCTAKMYGESVYSQYNLVQHFDAYTDLHHNQLVELKKRVEGCPTLHTHICTAIDDLDRFIDLI